MTDDREVRHFWYLPMDVVHHGRGALDELPGEVHRLGGARALVVTSPSTAERTATVGRIAALLGNRLTDVFAGVQPHVPYGCLQPALDLLRRRKADVLISVGGGSTVDAARALALAAGERVALATDLERFRARLDPSGETTIPRTSGQALPIIAVPTTLSAAEFANAGAVTSEARRTKDLLIADELTPRVVLLDPDVALQTPVDLWVATGMRAMDHAIETIYSPRRGPVTDVLSLDAVRRLGTALRAAHHDPTDVLARSDGQVAAWLSYFGEMNLTLGLSHAIGHQLGAQFGMQHGLTSCVVLPQVMRFLAPVVADRLRVVADALGVDTHRLSELAAAEAAAEAVESLVRDLGLPSRLADLGVTAEAFAGVAAAVMQDLVVAGSPRPITAAAQVEEILTWAA